MIVKAVNQELYDSRAALYILGALLHNPLLLQDDRFAITKSDFKQPIQQIIFSAIYNMGEQGFQSIGPVDIDLYLSQFKSLHEYYEKNKGYELILNLQEIAEDSKTDEKQFEFYYNRLKKFSILRDLQANGFDISPFYNAEKSFGDLDLEDEKLNKTPLREIPERIRALIVDIENRHMGKMNSTAQPAGKGIRALVDELREYPEVGLPLDGDMWNFTARGARKGKLYTYSAPSGAGKALPNSTIIPLANGTWKTVGEVREGDILIDRHGKPTKVTKIFPQGFKDVYKVSFKDGRSALCCDEHLWTYHDECEKDYYKLETKTLRELITLIEEKGIKSSGDWRYSIPVNEPVQYPHQTYKLDPYLLGLLFSNKLTKGKQIPDNYLIGDINQRLSLLQGLLDANGTVNEKGRIYFTSINKTLIGQVIILCRSLGLLTTINEDFCKEKYSSGHCYTININGSAEFKKQLFRLESKKTIIEVWYNNSEKKEKNIYNPIVDISYAGYQEEMTCFLVDNEEHLFLMNDYIVTHNTRHMVGNACSISLPFLQDGKVVVRENLEKVLFVATEMTADEIQTLILSYVSGVNESKILLGTATLEEREKIDKAVQIIEKYGDNFIIEAIPDPSIAMIKTTLTKYIIQNDIQYIFYDYIFSSPGLLNEFSVVGVREDVALMMLSNTLKEIAMTYKVFIESATQLNDSWAKQPVRNQNCIRGSKAIADKIDIGAIGVRLDQSDDEYKKIANIITERGLEVPNIVIDIYKNRRGEINNVKIFRKFDYGTCRCQDILMTDNSYNWKEESCNKLEYESQKIDFENLIGKENI